VEVGAIDANLLIYAYNEAALQHLAARRWFSRVLAEATAVYLPLSSIHAFVRIMTNERLFAPPLTPGQAVAAVESWLAFPNVRLLEPGPRYWSIFRSLVERHNIAGPLVSDAHLAALAIEHDVTLFTADHDFRRFKELRVLNPFTMI
jgi:uncharacterized protein